MSVGADSELYAGREQTLVKHYLLERYLERFAYIVGSKWRTLTYVDCFSGPWNVRSARLEDSSFYVALNQLRKAAADLHSKQGLTINLRCLFLEKNRSAFAKLKDFADSVRYADVQVRNVAFENSIEEIRSFVGAGGSSAFSFFFIDPTGWTGFSTDLIGPILRTNPGEVLEPVS